MKNYGTPVPVSNGKDKPALVYVPSSPTLIYIAAFQLFFTICIVGMQIAMVVGGYTNVFSLRADVSEMNEKFARIENVFVSASKKLPANQMELFTHQVVGILENAHQLSARFKFLIDKMEPSTSLAMLGDIKTITERLGGVLRDEGDIMHMVRTGNKMFENVTGEQMAELVGGLNNFGKKFDVQMLNELIEITKRVEKKLEALHEIKIQL